MDPYIWIGIMQIDCCMIINKRTEIYEKSTLSWVKFDSLKGLELKKYSNNIREESAMGVHGCGVGL